MTTPALPEWGLGLTRLSVGLAADRVEIRLDRPEHRNAIDLCMVEELHSVFEQLEREPRLLIITGGVDGIFAGGADVSELRRRGRDDALAGINLGLFDRLARLPLPTIAAIDGPALGGGAELAYACDLRIATTRAVFGQPEVRLGIMAAAGACHRLSELIGVGRAKELLFTGRRIGADEAERIGLVSRIVEPDRLLETAHEICDELAKASPIALRITKLAVDAHAAAGNGIELVGQAVLFDTAEKAERMDAFLSARVRRTAP